MFEAFEYRIGRRWAWLATSAVLIASAAQAQSTYAVSVSAGGLEPALLALASQTKQQIMFSKGIVAGRRAPLVRGQLTPEQALDQLLAGTDLRARRVNASLIVVERPSAGRSGTADTHPFVEAATVAEVPTVEAVEVTGTHLRGVRNTPSPVQVIDRAAFDRSGFQTVAAALQVLPQNFAGAGSESVVTLGTDRSTGNSYYATGINLRGLGANATLTLVNGRRFAGSGTNGDFVDISTLPSAGVERVEVLLDGASALYGSDAVGGVVNVIMRRHFDGAETRLSNGVATRGVPAEFQVSQSLGKTWATGGFIAAVEYNRRGVLPVADRSFTRTADLRPLGGTDRRLTFAHPGNILRVDPVTGASVAFWGIPTGQNGVGLQPGQFRAGAPNLGEPLEYSVILPRQERMSVYASATQSLGPNVELSADVNFGRRRYELPLGSLLSTLTVSRANPFFVSPNGSASHSIQYSFGEDLPPPVQRGQTQNLAVTFGADVTLPRDWRLSAYAAYGQARSRPRQTGLLHSTHLAEALGNAADNPATSYSAARDGFFNPFGDGAVNGATVLGFISQGWSTTFARNTVKSADLKLDGTLFQAPAGPVKLAVGGALRREAFARGGTSFTSGVAPIQTSSLRADRELSAAFLEVRAPLLGPDSPIGAVDLSLAGRLEHYSDFGTTTNPKLGVIWTPSEGLRLRASYGESFRAPSLPQLFGQQSYAPSRLPRGGVQVLSILLQGGNPTLQPETAKSWSFGVDYAPPQVPGLRLSATWFETDFNNRIDQPVRLNPSAALTDPTVASFVQLLSPATSPADLAAVQALLASPLYNVGLGVFPATQYGAIVDQRFVNTGVLNVAGLDVQADYAFDVGATQVQLGANVAYLHRYEASVTPLAPIIDRLNLANFPLKFRSRLTARATRGVWSGQAALNYVGRYRDSLGNRIDAQPTVDLQLQFVAPEGSALDGLSATLSVRNAFDRDPPFYDSPASVGYDPANGDPIGRFVSLLLVKRW